MPAVPPRARPVLPVAEFLWTWARGEPAVNGRPHPRLISKSVYRPPADPPLRKLPPGRLPPRLVAGLAPRAHGGLLARRFGTCSGAARPVCPTPPSHSVETRTGAALRALRPAPPAHSRRLGRAFADNRDDFFLVIARILARLRPREFRSGRAWDHDATAW